MKGIDVSEHQGLINWQAVKNDGVEFTIIRVGWGEVNNPIGGEMDSRALENISGALFVGLKVGLYIYSYAKDVREALLEANFVKTVLVQFPKDSFSAGTWIDIEDEKYQGDVDVNPIIDAFCSDIKNAGYMTGYYCNLNWYNNKVNQATKDKWTCWGAQYSDTADFSPSIWQYSSTGSVAGIDGNVDMNTSYIDFTSETKPVEVPFDIIHPPENTQSIVGIGIEYETCVEDYGWTPTSRNGFLSGSEGKSKRAEQIRIRLTGTDDEDVHVHYNVHVQDHGWMGFVADGAVAGVAGKRIEAIQIQLVGKDADKYSVEFRSHSQNVGTQDWAKDGELSGTEGGSLRLEAFAALIVPKGVDLGIDGIESFTHFEPVKTIEQLPVTPPPVSTSIFGQYFTKEEFMDDCGFPNHNGYSISDPCDGYPVSQYGKEANLNPRFYEVLNAFRARVGLPVVINCGVRCPSDNEAVGGVWNSCHLIGDAVDLYVVGMDIVEAAHIMWNEFGIPVRVYPGSGFMHIELNTSLEGVYNQEGYYFL